MLTRPQVRPDFIALLLMAAWILIGAAVEFYQIAWGTGVWLGQFALTWFLAFVFFGSFCILCLVSIAILLWQSHKLQKISSWLVAARVRIGFLRWILAVLLLLVPVYILQYTFWGIVLHGPYLRILLAIPLTVLISWLSTRPGSGLISWPALLVSLILMSTVIAVFAPLVNVTNYPFSLGWSEGNRLWDYSILFGRDVYLYPSDQQIPVYLDIGRQFVGGIPFLFRGITIWQARLWAALVDIVPYLVLGWVTFRLPKQNALYTLLAGIWAFTFVRQGPIHPPLLLCAILVALAWGRPLWLAVPLIFAAGYFAAVSRFTWLFAPAMWAVMLEFAGAYELNKEVWRRAIAVGIAGILGGLVAPAYLPTLVGSIKLLGQQASLGGVGAEISLFIVVVLLSILVTYGVRSRRWERTERTRTFMLLAALAFLTVGFLVLIRLDGGAGLLATIKTGLTSQPLLWNRLLPNETFGPGILFGIVIATLPLIIVLAYLVTSDRWRLNTWQKACIALPLVLFLIVGLIVSVKIGGGGDLHNLDMFIIGLLFVAAMAWRHGGRDWLRDVHAMPAWLSGVVIAMLVLPVLKPLTQMRPLAVHREIQLVVTLADILPNDPLPNPLPDTLPTEEDTQYALTRIQREIVAASSKGDILFMDQRQLLTFGYVKDVPLVPEYDKKVLIDQAMSDNAAYFEGFYNDLAEHRFALIVTSPLNRRLNTEEDNFGDENNAWVKWVTGPLLCYYEPLDVLKKVDVELLVPRAGVLDCTAMMPQ